MLINEKKSIEDGLVNYSESISRLKKSPATLYIKTQIIKTLKKETDAKNNLQNISEQLSDLESGKLDNKLKLELKKNSDDVKTKSEKKIQERKERKEEKDKNRSRSKNRGWIPRSIYQKTSNQPSHRDIRYEYKRYRYAVDTLPNYISNNLEEMPANKGYKWKGCLFFGKLPPIPRSPTVIFEKRKNILTITEWTDKEIRVFEKVGRNRKQLVSSQKRRKKVGLFSLMDYVKE